MLTQSCGLCRLTTKEPRARNHPLSRRDLPHYKTKQLWQHGPLQVWTLLCAGMWSHYSAILLFCRSCISQCSAKRCATRWRSAAALARALDASSALFLQENRQLVCIPRSKRNTTFSLADCRASIALLWSLPDRSSPARCCSPGRGGKISGAPPQTQRSEALKALRSLFPS